jgi:predicted 2-oxoglutarate/Fe(II)-dependent dioxygenase YbiX
MVKRLTVIMVALLFAFSITAIAFAADKTTDVPAKPEKAAPAMGEKKAGPQGAMKKDTTDQGEKKVTKTKKAKKAKKVKKAKKAKKAKKPASALPR